MQLDLLNCQNTGITDLAAKGMPLNNLNIPGTKVTDLSTLNGMITLKWLSLGNLARLTDLSPLKGLAVEDLHVENFKAERDATILRGISTLKTINGKPVAEFWKEIDEKKDKKP